MNETQQQALERVTLKRSLYCFALQLLQIDTTEFGFIYYTLESIRKFSDSEQYTKEFLRFLKNKQSAGKLRISGGNLAYWLYCYILQTVQNEIRYYYHLKEEEKPNCGNVYVASYYGQADFVNYDMIISVIEQIPEENRPVLANWFYKHIQNEQELTN